MNNNIYINIDKIETIIDKLVNHSGYLFEIIYDNKLPMPGMSFIEKDFRGMNRYKVVINYDLVKNESSSVIAHILSHEWGHHILKHTLVNPSLLSAHRISETEIEADTYAYNFIIQNNYNIEDIQNYIKKNFEYESRDFKNKLDLFKKRINVLNNNISN
jgi:AAA+ ATPase superfamily predicted ATPase